MAKKSDQERLQEFRQKAHTQKVEEVLRQAEVSKGQVDGKDVSFNHLTGQFE